MSPRTGRLLLLSALLLAGFSGCSRKEAPPEPELRCSTGNLSAAGRLSLKMLAPHAGELAVVDPAGRFFLLAFDEPLAGVEPMIEARVFRRMGELELDPQEARAAYRGSGGQQTEIFTKSGTYQVLLGENLRGEHPRIAGRCEVQFSAAEPPR